MFVAPPTETCDWLASGAEHASVRRLIRRLRRGGHVKKVLGITP